VPTPAGRRICQQEQMLTIHAMRTEWIPAGHRVESYLVFLVIR
jgi:hypothetical protein